MFELGNSLREARERQGRSFSDLERKTQIRTRYLKALEEEQFSLLPAPAYMRGFLRVYADDFGLDGQLYVDEFNSRFSVSEEVVSTTQSRERRVPVQTHQHSRRVATGAVVVALATIIVVSLVIIAAFTSNPRQPAVPNLNTQTTNQGATRLTITAARADTFLDVRPGGESGTPLYQGMLLKGRSKSFSASTLWMQVTAIQNLSWTLAGKTSTAGTRVGPATVLFGPNGPKFLSK